MWMTTSGFREDEGVHFRSNSAEPLRTFKIYKHEGGYQKRSVAWNGLMMLRQ